MSLIVLRIEQWSDPNGHFNTAAPVISTDCGSSLVTHEVCSVLSPGHLCVRIGLVWVKLDVIVACTTVLLSRVLVQLLQSSSSCPSAIILLLGPLLHFNSYFILKFTN